VAAMIEQKTNQFLKFLKGQKKPPFGENSLRKGKGGKRSQERQKTRCPGRRRTKTRGSMPDEKPHKATEGEAKWEVHFKRIWAAVYRGSMASKEKRGNWRVTEVKVKKGKEVKRGPNPRKWERSEPPRTGK